MTVRELIIQLSELRGEFDSKVVLNIWSEDPLNGEPITVEAYAELVVPVSGGVAIKGDEV